MRFQVNGGGRFIDQTLIPPSTVIDLADKQDHEMTPSELLAKGRPIPLDVTALDADCAISLWKSYPDHRHRLRRNLDPAQEALFARLRDLDPAALEAAWPTGKG
jgi:hypothetical protein